MIRPIVIRNTLLQCICLCTYVFMSALHIEICTIAAAQRGRNNKSCSFTPIYNPVAVDLFLENLLKYSRDMLESSTYMHTYFYQSERCPIVFTIYIFSPSLPLIFTGQSSWDITVWKKNLLIKMSILVSAWRSTQERNKRLSPSSKAGINIWRKAK